MKRNPSVLTKIALTLDSGRVEGAAYEAMQQFYETLHSVKQRYEIQDENIWKINEYWMAPGICSNSTGLIPVTIKKAYKKAPKHVNG